MSKKSTVVMVAIIAVAMSATSALADPGSNQGKRRGPPDQVPHIEMSTCGKPSPAQNPSYCRADHRSMRFMAEEKVFPGRNDKGLEADDSDAEVMHP